MQLRKGIVYQQVDFVYALTIKYCIMKNPSAEEKGLKKKRKEAEVPTAPLNMMIICSILLRVCSTIHINVCGKALKSSILWNRLQITEAILIISSSGFVMGRSSMQFVYGYNL